MGWFNVLKGAYPALDMITTTLPMKSGETDIVRGTLLVNDAGNFRKAVAGDALTGAIPYFALQAQTDWNAKMAGNLATQIPVLGGIPVTYGMEVETDQFNSAVAYTINDNLTVGAGVVTKYTAALNQTIVGCVTGVPRKRWVNDAPVAGGQRTGQAVMVISFLTLYIPMALIDAGVTP